MVQTVRAAQELYANAALLDRHRLAELQEACSLAEAEYGRCRLIRLSKKPAFLISLGVHSPDYALSTLSLRRNSGHTSLVLGSNLRTNRSRQFKRYFSCDS